MLVCLGVVGGGVGIPPKYKNKIIVTKYLQYIVGTYDSDNKLVA